MELMDIFHKRSTEAASCPSSKASLRLPPPCFTMEIMAQSVLLAGVYVWS